METIFDYNPTDEELDMLGIKYKSKEEYIQKTSERKVLFDLRGYFILKDDMKTAHKYSDLIRAKGLIPKYGH